MELHEDFSKFFMGTYNHENINTIDIDNGYRIWEGGSPLIVDGPEFKYIINKVGFRSQHFENFDSQKINILCSGDSFTFGDGLPEDSVWPSILKRTLKDRDIMDAEIYNVGANGASVRQIIKNAMAFIRRYGKPDYLFILFSPSSRDIIYDESNSRFTRGMYEQKWVNNAVGSERKARMRFYMGTNEYESLFYAIDQIFMLEDLCRALGIKLIWSTFDGLYDAPAYDLAGFNNFAMYSLMNSENIYGLDYWDIAKDNNHPGSKWHCGLVDTLINKMLAID